MMFFDPDIIVPWVNERTSGGLYVPGTCSAIGRIKDGKIVGGIYYEDFNGKNITCHIASENGERWLNRTFLWMIFDYPFNQLKSKRMTAPVAYDNERCINFVEKLGFTREAILHDAHPNGDLYIYTLFEKDCRWHKDLKNEIYEQRPRHSRDTIAEC